MKTVPQTGHTVHGPRSMQKLEDIALQSPVPGGRRRAASRFSAPGAIHESSVQAPQVKHGSLVGWTLAAVWLLALPAWAVEYRLQVAHLDFLTFASYMEQATPWWRQNEPMARLEARLDTMEFPRGAGLPGREVQVLADPDYGVTVPARLALLPVAKRQAWTTLVWEGTPGDTVGFMVKSEMRAWQEVWAVAANAEGPLRRLSMGGPALFGRQWREVPEVSYDFLANAVDQGAFPRWVAHRATAINGVSVVVGRGRSRFYDPDRVYLLLKLPPEPRTFKLVIGWRDHDNRGDGNGGPGGPASR
jgi:hypothetical protein